MVIAAEKSRLAPEMFAGILTDTGERLLQSVRQALTEALVRFDNYLLSTWGVSRGWSRGSPAIVRRTRPSFFIYSRYGGDHWTEWVPEGCPPLLPAAAVQFLLLFPLPLHGLSAWNHDRNTARRGMELHGLPSCAISPRLRIIC